MKNKLMLSVVLIVFGLACFTVSMLSKSHAVETWSSFLFGFSFPVFISGIVTLVKYYKGQNTANQA